MSTRRSTQPNGARGEAAEEISTERARRLAAIEADPDAVAALEELRARQAKHPPVPLPPSILEETRAELEGERAVGKNTGKHRVGAAPRGVVAEVQSPLVEKVTVAPYLLPDGGAADLDDALPVEHARALPSASPRATTTRVIVPQVDADADGAYATGSSRSRWLVVIALGIVAVAIVVLAVVLRDTGTAASTRASPSVSSNPTPRSAAVVVSGSAPTVTPPPVPTPSASASNPAPDPPLTVAKPSATPSPQVDRTAPIPSSPASSAPLPVPMPSNTVPWVE